VGVVRRGESKRSKYSVRDRERGDEIRRVKHGLAGWLRWEREGEKKDGGGDGKGKGG